ncbi:hypothetical protein DFP73DRAFT_549123 [Morchella snyderi]|nr:hypothetical protein DFP73DRAFT_549123 [Morchella snyderi]
MGEQKSNPWPKHIWGLFLLSLLFSCAVLTSLGWYGLNGNGFSTGFPAWLPGVAAALTLVCTIINITSTNPNACEIFVHDAIQVLLWSAATIKISIFITNKDAFGSCEKMSVRSTCIGAQLALWFGVALLHVSFAKLITAFYVHRNMLNPKHQTTDCEKQFDAVQ